MVDLTKQLCSQGDHIAAVQASHQQLFEAIKDICLNMDKLYTRMRLLEERTGTNNYNKKKSLKQNLEEKGRTIEHMPSSDKAKPELP